MDGANPIPGSSQQQWRDPRFDPRCNGSNDPRHFYRNYAFLDEVRKRELDELQRALKKEKDPEKRDKIKMAITRYRNKMIDRQQKQKFNAKKKRGFKEKKVELIEKFKQLKESGKLTKYLERKRKKLLKRDQKLFSSH
jgi:ribosomal RNA-processing protein 36